MSSEPPSRNASPPPNEALSLFALYKPKEKRKKMADGEKAKKLQEEQIRAAENVQDYTRFNLLASRLASNPARSEYIQIGKRMATNFGCIESIGHKKKVFASA